MADENMNMPSTPGSTSSPQAGSRNKMWYIIGGIVILLLLLSMMPRVIGSATMHAVGAGNGVNVSGTPGGPVTYSNGEGSVTVGGGSMPDNWPSDAPANYTGASIQYSGASNPQTGKAGSAVVYTVNASAQSIVDYYKTELGKDGWTIEATANTGAATVLSGKKDTRTFGVYIVSTGNGAVSVTVGIGM